MHLVFVGFGKQQAILVQCLIYTGPVLTSLIFIYFWFLYFFVPFVVLSFIFIDINRIGTVKGTQATNRSTICRRTEGF